MITSLLFGIISILIGSVNFVLGFITIAIPTEIQASIAYLLGYVWYAQGVVNIPAFFGAITFLTNVLIAYFGFKVLVWIWKLIPDRWSGNMAKKT